MGWEIISSEKKFSGKALGVRVDRLRLPDGGEALLEIIDHVGSSVMVPVDEDGGIWFVRQYRHAAGREMLELPAGTLHPGEDPRVCAGRELREEIGMGARMLEKVGGFFLAPGYATEFMHVFLASGLFPDRMPGDEDERLFPEKITLKKVRQMLESGSFEDAKTIAALALTLPGFHPEAI
jgi:ADP-ribose pyrophosphatase